MDDILNLELLMLQKKTKEEPNNPMYWVDYGDFLLEKLELYQDAISAFEKASELLPNSDLRLRIGEALFLDNRGKEAIEILKQSVTANPREEAYTILANCFISTENYKNAREALEKALTLNENYEEALYLLGEIEEDPLKAISNFKKAITIDTDYQLAWGSLGRVYLKQKKFDQAIEALKTAIELDENDIWATVYLANTYWNIGEIKKAELFYSKALLLDPNSEEIKVWYLEFLESTGKSEKAKAIGLIGKN
ncbi:MAG: tetratricopeptide repeat protein [Balneolaceae bacterium]|nr:tetratricopeptide repeat protein [Balneolaceae bacterium]MBO6547131.1 tetratricopeptide repeat protein [Balneolaceae bacterium]MBO6647922.1 tetratricopeptide repeat protein [Balneolaceae bacterium]